MLGLTSRSTPQIYSYSLEGPNRSDPGDRSYQCRHNVSWSAMGNDLTSKVLQLFEVTFAWGGNCSRELSIELLTEIEYWKALYIYGKRRSTGV
jgi:hypothetical protein